MKRRFYMSYLLRLWRDDSEPPVWHTSLDNPSTFERQVFPNLESLFAFLQDKCSSTSSICANGQTGEDINST